MMPLIFAKIGEESTIQKVNGNEETKRFLENLGFLTGTKIIVLSMISGNMIINIRNTRIAINKEMAKCILISE